MLVGRLCMKRTGKKTLVLYITLYVGGQIVYEENSGFFTLYVVAQSSAERQEWVEAIRRGQSVSQWQYSLLAPSVCCSQMVWGCACACVQHWHSTEWTEIWICQHSAYFNFIPSTHTHTCTHTHTHTHTHIYSHTIWGPQTDGAKSGHCPVSLLKNFVHTMKGKSS